VEAVPGASAVLAALAVAGIPCDAFTFAGFLPRQGRERATALASIRHATHATVLYESPRRVAETLVDLRDHVGAERRVALCRELTKLHEEVRRGTAAELAASITGDVLGEVTLVVGGRGEVTEDPATGEKAAEIAKWAVDHGLGARDASELVRLATGLAKSKAYALCLELQGKAPAKAGD
ncbi:MAG: 16S rRNA (cytidine(1402)-2'-O)-methyltransferase, partial [Myxococcales bacterium]|nr:16S rRNA (cytidine(1402)-2'-O)-methyltransferase [Myxococcales bacterium]